MKKAEEKGADLKHSYMFWLPLIAVLREGIETVIFLAGTSSQYEVTIICSCCLSPWYLLTSSVLNMRAVTRHTFANSIQ